MLLLIVNFARCYIFINLRTSISRISDITNEKEGGNEGCNPWLADGCNFDICPWTFSVNLFMMKEEEPVELTLAKF